MFKLIPMYENEVVLVEELRITFIPVIRTIQVGNVIMDRLTVVGGRVVPEIDLIPVTHTVRVPRLIRAFQGYRVVSI